MWKTKKMDDKLGKTRGKTKRKLEELGLVEVEAFLGFVLFSQHFLVFPTVFIKFFRCWLTLHSKGLNWSSLGSKSLMTHF